MPRGMVYGKTNSIPSTWVYWWEWGGVGMGSALMRDQRIRMEVTLNVANEALS